MRLTTFLYMAVFLGSSFNVSAQTKKTFSTCFTDWRLPTCSDKDPQVGRTCVSMRQGYDACIAEVRAESDRKKRAREATERERKQKDEAEAAKKKQERIAKQREAKRAELEAIEKADGATRKLKKLNGPRPSENGVSSTPGTIHPTKPRDESEKKAF
jgi:hypothetical protein